MSNQVLSNVEKELPYLLALWRIPGLGPREFIACLDGESALSELFRGSRSIPDHLKRSSRLIDGIKRPDWSGVDKDLAWLSHQQCCVVPITSKAYPPLLKEVPHPPPILFVKGQVSTLHSTQLAVVGSRRATASGLQIAKQWSRALAARGITITSGLALGIDGAAHQGALSTGKTIAVLAHGLNQIYPRAHQALAEEIVASGGALVSEFPIGVSPLKHHFPRRNRLISGLSQGTLVVEAALRSGSLVTARHALEQNREVFAIPGSIHSPLSKGGHALIKQGAKLVESLEDILQESIALGEASHQ